MKKNLTITALLLLSGLANSQAENLISVKRQVFDQAQKFATASACETTFEASADYPTTLDHVYPIEFGEDGGESSAFFVFWGGDLDCSGGSGTYIYSLTEFQRVSDGRPFTVGRNYYITWRDSGLDGRFVESMRQDERGEVLTIVSYEQNENDEANQRGSEKYEYTYSFSESEGGFLAFKGKTKIN